MTRKEEIITASHDKRNYPCEVIVDKIHDPMIFSIGAEWADSTMIEKASDAFCKVCGHYPHSVPASICRHDCDYYSDFVKHLKTNSIG